MRLITVSCDGRLEITKAMLQLAWLRQTGPAADRLTRALIRHDIMWHVLALRRSFHSLPTLVFHDRVRRAGYVVCTGAVTLACGADRRAHATTRSQSIERTEALRGGASLPGPVQGFWHTSCREDESGTQLQQSDGQKLSYRFAERIETALRQGAQKSCRERTGSIEGQIVHGLPARNPSFWIKGTRTEVNPIFVSAAPLCWKSITAPTMSFWQVHPK